MTAASVEEAGTRMSTAEEFSAFVAARADHLYRQARLACPPPPERRDNATRRT
jgi:hypothetical protein